MSPVDGTAELTTILDQNEREAVKMLEEELNKMKEELQRLNNDHQKQQNLITTLTQKCRLLTDANSQLAGENSELKKRIAVCETSLTEALQHRTDPHKHTDPHRHTDQSRADKEHMEMLEAQLGFYREDFESERRDRERAQCKLAEVEQKLSLAQRQLKQYEIQSMHSLSQRREAALALHREEYERKHTASPSLVSQHSASPSLVSRGVYQTDGLAEGYDEIDCGGASASPAVHQNTVGDNNERLCCPICRRDFTVDQHADLLEHIETAH